MALSTMLKKLAKQRAAYEETLKEAGKAGKDAIGEHLGAMIPPGYALTWTQGTPAFNDGDPCTFSVHDPELIKFGEPYTSEDYDDETLDEVDGEERSLDNVIDEYGKPDRTETYKRNDYSKPIQGKPGEYEKVDESYEVKGFPAIEGYTVEDLQKLHDAFHELPEDLMDEVFSGDAKVRIYSGGRVNRDDYYME